MTAPKTLSRESSKKGVFKKRDDCSFRHEEPKRRNWAPKTAPSSDPRTENDGEKSSRGKSHEVTIPLGSKLERRAETTSKASARDHRVFSGILPNVRITKAIGMQVRC